MESRRIQLADWPALAAEWGPQVHGVVVLEGPMGAGKTTWVAALGKALNWQDSVQSPTFGLIHTYRSADGSPVYHLDLYRLKDEREAWGLDLEDLFHSGALCLVEWAEKIPTFLPEKTQKISIEYQEDMDFRLVTFRN